MMRLHVALLAGGMVVGLASPAAAAVPAVGLAEAWQAHPVLTQTRQAGLWDEPALRWVAEPGMPLDRVWALAEALPPAQVRKQRLAEWLTGRVVGLHLVGPSGALRPVDVRVRELTGAQALALGWLRLLALDRGGPLPLSAGNQSGDARVVDASPIDLLARAAVAAPDEQAAQVASALVEALVLPAQPKPARCAALQRTADALAAPRGAALPRSSVERLLEWTRTEARACPWRAPALPEPWPAPAAWPTQAVEAGPQRPPPAERTVTGNVHPYGEAFVLTAPLFQAWLANPAVQAVLQRKRLWPGTLADALAADPGGDAAVVALNAGLHVGKLAVWDLPSLVWEALRLRHPDWPVQRTQAQLGLDALQPGEALLLGYALALAADWLRPQPAQLTVATARAQDLLDQARRTAGIDAVWAPWLWQLLPVDQLRSRDPCAAAARARTLAEVLAKSAKMPEAAKTALAMALQTVASRCPASGGVPDSSSPQYSLPKTPLPQYFLPRERP